MKRLSQIEQKLAQEQKLNDSHIKEVKGGVQLDDKRRAKPGCFAFSFGGKKCTVNWE